MSDEKIEQYTTDYFNHDAFIEYAGKVYKFETIDIDSLKSPSLYWNSKSNPSTWLVGGTVTLEQNHIYPMENEQ